MASVAAASGVAGGHGLEPLPPISPEVSPPHEVIQSDALLQYLDAQAPLISEAERARREEVLIELMEIFREWVREVSVDKGVYADLESAEEAGGRIYPSGSYFLGVNEDDGDIDTVCVAPIHVTRQDFFTSLPPKLKRHHGYNDMLMVPDAKVPIIELKICGIDIDLQFVSMPRPSIPLSMDIMDDKVLVGLDATSMRTLNGPRTNMAMWELIPHFDHFKVLLRALRLWFKRRGLYSNKTGYMGGVNLAVLAAWTVEMYPALSPAGLLKRFFTHFTEWNWRETPVFLTVPKTKAGIGFNDEVWTNTGRDVMPILTPAYPCMSSSYNVTTATFQVMFQEFWGGRRTVTEILEATSPRSDPADPTAVLPPLREPVPDAWAPLFAPSDFFARYDSYVMLTLSATCPTDLRAWKGWFEAKFRALTTTFEFGRAPLLAVQPWTAALKREVVAELEVPAEDAKLYPPAPADVPVGTVLNKAAPPPAHEAEAVITAGPVTPMPGSSESREAATAEPSAGAAETSSSSAAEAVIADISVKISSASAESGSAATEQPVAGAGSAVPAASSSAPAPAAAAAAPPVAPPDVLVAQPVQEGVGSVSSSAAVDAKQSEDKKATLAPVPELGAVVPVTTAVVTAAAAVEGDAAAASPATVRVRTVQEVYLYFVGLTGDPRASMGGGPVSLSPHLKAFKEGTLLKWTGFKPGMEVRQQVVAWERLPDEVFELFPPGPGATTRKGAAAVRAALRAQAREMQRQAEEAQQLAVQMHQQRLKWVRGQPAPASPPPALPGAQSVTAAPVAVALQPVASALSAIPGIGGVALPGLGAVAVPGIGAAAAIPGIQSQPLAGQVSPREEADALASDAPAAKRHNAASVPGLPGLGSAAVPGLGAATTIPGVQSTPLPVPQQLAGQVRLREEEGDALASEAPAAKRPNTVLMPGPPPLPAPAPPRPPVLPAARPPAFPAPRALLGPPGAPLPRPRGPPLDAPKPRMNIQLNKE